MNSLHLQLLSSPEWKQYLESDLLPWVLAQTELGPDVVEVGPGPGLTTDLLRSRVEHLTAVEVDRDLATALEERLAGTNVEVLCADATSSGLPSAHFTAATCFTMLHHVPSVELQDRLLAEMHRILRPGGVFVGTDATDSPALRDLHVDDVFVPVDPDALPTRLRGAGFEEVTVEQQRDRLRFVARKA